MIGQWEICHPSKRFSIRQNAGAYGVAAPTTANSGSAPVQCAHLSLAEKERALCIPLITQGEISGILVLLWNPDTATVCGGRSDHIPARIRRVGTAVAEQMALTLANLHLRAPHCASRPCAIRSIRACLTAAIWKKPWRRRELQHAIRRDRPVSLLMLDLDHFKKCNDQFGHDVGDLVLHSVGQFLLANTRAEDIVCRYGGEEFIVVMLEATVDDAQLRAQQVREGIKQLEVTYQGRRLEPTTVSIGLACSTQGPSNACMLIKAATPPCIAPSAKGGIGSWSQNNSCRSGRTRAPGNLQEVGTKAIRPEHDGRTLTGERSTLPRILHAQHHQPARSQHGADHQQASSKVPCHGSEPPDNVRTKKAAQVSDGIDQGDTHSHGGAA